MSVLEGAVTSALNLCSWSEGVKATAEDEGEEGREGGYTSEEEERMQLHQEPRKETKMGKQSTTETREEVDHDENNELTFSANRCEPTQEKTSPEGTELLLCILLFSH